MRHCRNKPSDGAFRAPPSELNDMNLTGMKIRSAWNLFERLILRALRARKINLSNNFSNRF
jgi:hypothetical protein